ncbi:MAG: hypothetical protein GY759_20065 [Chloroflexi bacterium]|nr:hypothetical protein [Chloroflexota bacterium]
MEVDSPGQINRIWFADSEDPGFPKTRMQSFFDGAEEISYEITVADMMLGQDPPFVRPFVLDKERSSMGWISYVPIPFRSGIKVRLLGFTTVQNISAILR